MRAAAVEVTAATGESVGSGVIYSADGWIVTNRHVVEGATGITVHLKDGRDVTGTIYGIDTLDEFELTRGYVEGRRIARTMEEFYRRHVPGFQNFELLATASLLG